MTKKWVIGIFVLAFLTMAGCEYNFSKGINKDLLSGLTVTNDGLSVDEVYLTVDDERTSENVFDYGSEVYMNFTGVENWEKDENGLVYPGAMMVVADKDGREIFEEDDLFEQYTDTGVEANLASDLFVSLMIGAPLEEGEQYTWYAKVWDKVGGGVIEAEMGIGVN